jgi:hypothetical protein
VSRIGKQIFLVAQVASACCALVGLMPSVGSANELRVSSYEMSEAGGIVLLESDAPIGEPWLRVDPKSVRVWFPNVADVARFDHSRDASEPIRSLMLRPGAQDSAVIRIDVGGGLKLTRDNIEITRAGQTAKIRITFPAAPHAPAATPASHAPLAAPATASASPPPPPSAAKPLVLNGQAAPIAAAKPALATKQTALATATTKSMGIGMTGGSNQNIGLLLMISAMLLAVYACIKKFAKPRTIRAQDIEVLSARRLGNRSELLLVRALGSDHLLVTSPGRIERVASVPTPIDLPLLAPSLMPPAAAAPANASVEADSQAEGLGIITKLSSRSRLRKLLDAVDKESSEVESEPPPPAPAARDSRRPASFGPELLSAMNHHKFSGLSSLPSIANKQSDAVAGIARLRAGTRAN